MIEAVIDYNRKSLLEMIEPYKKMNVCYLSDEKFEMRKYFHELGLEKARTAFAIDTQMLKTVKSIYPSDKRNEDDLWTCDQCTRVDSIRHLTRCPYFTELRENKNLHDNREDIVTYFQEVIEIRLDFEQAQPI